MSQYWTLHYLLSLQKECNGSPVTEPQSAKQVAVATLNSSIGECPGGTLKGIDLAWRDNFCVKKERLRDGKKKRQADGHEGQQGEEQVDAISRVEDSRKLEEEKGRENLAGEELGPTENPNGDTEAGRSDEEEESRGPRGSYRVGGEEEPSRKEDTTKGPRHVPGGAWLYKVYSEGRDLGPADLHSIPSQSDQPKRKKEEKNTSYLYNMVFTYLLQNN
ncbi:hypothetical protein NDU88_002158 [Pleurodeles waltl]|uniref:Uncharacterized protein n=1 Tax=Pleurodeles waltl TaxID=8319 RepID=A0AAV7U8L8_PLEWA|nr:hypothetical protein NDU88_002158 [Pleurodeles waltl]